MPHEYEISKLLTQPLDDVLMKLYSNSVLSWLHQEILTPLIEADPALQKYITSTSIGAPKKVPKKEEKIAILKTILDDPKRRSAFYARLPDPLKTVLARITWHGEQHLDAIEKMAGETIADPNPIENRRYYEPFILREAYGLIVLVKTGNPYSFYGYREKEISKKDINACLPEAMVRLFKSVIPPPPEYDLLPMDAPHPTATLRYMAPRIMQEIKAAAEFIEQGHVKYTKNEQLSKVSIRKFRQVINGMEFFTEGNNDNELMRTQLLLGTVSFAGKEFRQKLLGATSAEPFKQIFTKLSPAFLDEELLVHLRHSGDFNGYNRHLVARLGKFAADMPAGKWVSDSNILNYFRFRGETPSVYAQIPRNLQSRSTRDSGYRFGDPSEKTVFTLISAPLLRGYAFLLAALGMAEIAYTPSRIDDGSPFKGLDAVRLTPLGEFVFGKRKTLDIEVADIPRSEVLLDSNRLMASCRNLDSLTELALKQFMERLTDTRFRMTHKSLLGGCSSREALEERIALFRRVIAAAPPPVWEQFFTSTFNRIAPLQKESELLVFKLDTDEETRRLFSTDPFLRQHCLKVEGYRIAIARQDIRTVCKHLEKSGCLCPPASLID